MTNDRPRYLRIRANRDGTSRFYWMPDATLERAGFRQERLPDDWPQAVARAAAINATVDAWRARGCPPLAGAIEAPAPRGKPRRGTVAHLIELYRAPPADAPAPAVDPLDAAMLRGVARNHRHYSYASLKPNTRRSYDDALRYIAKWLGPVPVRAVDSAMVVRRLDTLRQRVHADGPHAGKQMVSYANQIGRVGRLLFAAARLLVPKDHPCWVGLDANPFRELGMPTAASNARIWTLEERDALIAAARAGCDDVGQTDSVFPPLESVATAIVLNWWIGQREDDVLNLPREPLAADTLTIVQAKTTAAVHLPLGIVPEIVAAIGALKASQARAAIAGTRLLIDEETRLVWTGDRFRRAFARVRAAAVRHAEATQKHELARSLQGLQFQWLRHTAVVGLQDAGATVPEIASITGHTLQSVTQILERYGRRTRRQAENALRKRMEGEGR